MRRAAAYWRCLATIKAMDMREVADCGSEAIAGAIAAKHKYPFPLDLVEWIETKRGAK